MASAVLFGAGSGALHAVSGPDHVLSLGPLALGQPRSSLRIGLSWGLGHGVGTLLLALPLLLLWHHFQAGGWSDVVERFAVAERLAGLALIVTAAWSLRNATQPTHLPENAGRGPGLVGFVHGVSGAGALVFVLPVLISGDLTRSALFLVAFAAGSTIAMAALTALIGHVGSRLKASVIGTLQRGLLLGALALGVFWLVAP